MVAADVTRVFHEVVSVVEKRQASLDGPRPAQPHRILPQRKKTKDPLETLARDIAAAVTNLRDFLLEHREQYLDVLRETSRGSNAISDNQRDRIDASANTFMRTANQLIAKFQSEFRACQNLGESRKRHLEAVGDILESYLKAVCGIYAEQKAIRVQKELELQKLSRLEIKALRASESETLEDRARALRNQKAVATPDSEDSTGGESKKPSCVSNAPVGTFEDDGPDNSEYHDLSPEEMQLLEEENAKLYEDFMTTKDAVQQIENKVVKIVELQEIFTEKVMQQKDDIDLISQHAVTSTENVKDGNEELRKAIQNQASTRVYILFVLLVLSFTLLFLDWYNE